MRSHTRFPHKKSTRFYFTPPLKGRVTIKPDRRYAGMWRLAIDGHLTDMTNLARAKDAAAAYLETEARRQRARWSLQQARSSRGAVPAREAAA
jgi:hypothetical protein